MANWGEINAKLGSIIGSPANRCPTRAMVEATGKAAVAVGYASNQLVPLSAVNSIAPELKDNNITLSVSRLNATTWQVVASAQYPVASVVTVEGAYIDDFSAGSRYFQLTIGSNSGMGSTTFITTEFATTIELEYANSYPGSDGVYRYNLQY